MRGARQTGKTYIVSEFGKHEFENLIYLSFERNPEYKDIFNTNIPVEIADKITLYTTKKPVPGKMFFLDEIQECPDAVGESELRRYILDFSKLAKLPQSLHDKLNEYVRKYFIVGAMSAVEAGFQTATDPRIPASPDRNLRIN